MKKRGFTLIEIIICLVVLGVVGTTSTVVVANKNKANELDKLNERIFDAANVFVEIEKDENGNNYLVEIARGAKGIQVPLSILVDKGYLEENSVKRLYEIDNAKPEDNPNKSYYVTFLGNGDYCDESQYEMKSSWMDDNVVFKLCKNYDAVKIVEIVKKEVEKDPTIIEKIVEVPIIKEIIVKDETIIKNVVDLEFIQKYVNIKYSSDKYAVSDVYINKNELYENAKFTSEENGIFLFQHQTGIGNYIYTFFRGAVDNNYLKLGKDENGNDLYWRIIWLRDDNKAKIVLDKTIPLTLNNISGEPLSIKGQKLYKFVDGKNNANDLIFLAPKLNTEETYYSENRLGRITAKYNLYLPDESKWVSIDEFDFSNNEGEITEKDNFYMSKTLDWYNKTDLSNYSFITKENNFCINESIYYPDSDWDEYYPSENFDCSKGSLSKSSSPKDYSKIPNYYSQPIGFLTYGDVIMAGLSKVSSGVTNLYDSKNYLISDNNTYPLQDLKDYYGDRTDNGLPYESFTNYFVGPSGISNANSYVQKSNYKDFKETYTLYDSTKENVLISSYNNYSKSYYYYNFFANSLKPAMILDLTDYRISSASGTKENPYIIEKR